MSTEQFARKIDQILRRLDELEAQSKINYAKGTYTPTYFGATTAGVTTYTTQEGRYRRIGDTVDAWGKLVWTNATGTGVIRLGGLPYTSLADAPFYVRTVNVTFANGSIQGIIQASQVVGQAFSPATNAAGTELAIEAAGSLWYHIRYLVG